MAAPIDAFFLKSVARSESMLPVSSLIGWHCKGVTPANYGNA